MDVFHSTKISDVFETGANGTETIGHVRYINIQAWLRGFRVKIANFSRFFCPSIPKGDLDTKKTTPNIEVWPESLGAMLEYWYIERGLFLEKFPENMESVKFAKSEPFNQKFRKLQGESKMERKFPEKNF